MSRSSREDSLSEEFERQLMEKDKEIIRLMEKIVDYQDRVHEVLDDKRIVQERLDELELLDSELRLKKYQEMEEEYLRMDHRVKVTKKLLDESREDLKFHKKVIQDLVNLSIFRHIFRRYPPSFQDYKNRKKN